jgi:hypothetical protein
METYSPKGEKGAMSLLHEILEALKKLTATERIALIEAALHLIREDLRHIEQPQALTEKKRQLATAAEVLLPDYAAGGELTVFMALDSEDLDAQG